MQLGKYLQFLFYTFLFNLLFVQVNAQSGLNFQGVARSNNSILASQFISLKLSILQGGPAGVVEYVETRSVMTNAQGLFSVVIGDTGAIQTVGNFSTVNWKNNPKFLKIEMDPNAGNNFTTMGITQLQSVPYAHYAAYANSVEAENIKGTIGIAQGGTGLSSLSALKSALGVDKVNNTTDIEKPINNLTQIALNAKANAADSIKYVKLPYLDSMIQAKLSASNFQNASITDGAWSGSTIALAKGGTGATTAADARAHLGLVIGTDVMAANATTTLRGDVSGSGSGSFTTTVNSMGGVSSATIATLPTIVQSNTSSITSNTSSIATIHTSLGTKADLASPAFTGVPTAPTASLNDHSNALATTAFVKANLSSVSAETLSGTHLASTITGSSLTTVGTITTGTWSGTVIGSNLGGAGAVNGLLKAGGNGVVSAAIAGTDYQLPLIAGTNYLVPNTSISAATKTKLTYDAKGLVIAGADATTADIAPSANRNYLTDAQAGVLSNTAGINTGDETNSSIKSKLGITTLSGTNTGDQTISLTGDITGTGSGTFTTTLSNTGVVSGTYGSSTSIPTITVDTKGRLISAGTATVQVDAGNLTGTTLNSTITNSSLTGLGTISSGTWSATTIAVANGGTGLTVTGTNGQVLTSTGSGTLTWTTPTSNNSNSTTYSVGLNPDLGGYVVYVTADGKHGLVFETILQGSSINWTEAIDAINNPLNHSVNGRKFTDWRMPTRYELNLLYTKRSGYLSSGSESNWVVYQYIVWSSLVNPAYHNAFLLNMQNGDTGWNPVNDLKAVVAIRSF